MLLSSDAGFGSGAAGARRGALGAAQPDVTRSRGRAFRSRAARCRSTRAALGRPLRAALGRSLCGLFLRRLRDIFLLDALRDFAAVFAVFRRFLAMRAPPGEWARILSDKLIARVLILRVLAPIPARCPCPPRVRGSGWRAATSATNPGCHSRRAPSRSASLAASRSRFRSSGPKAIINWRWRRWRSAA